MWVLNQLFFFFLVLESIVFKVRHRLKLTTHIISIQQDIFHNKGQNRDDAQRYKEDDT